MRFTEQERATLKNKLRDRGKNAAIIGHDGSATVLLNAAAAIEELEGEVERLNKLAYLTIPLPKFLSRRRS